MSDFILSNNTPYTMLDCTEAFHLLTEEEKLYSHYLSRASWLGSLIVLLQTSQESPLIFSMLHRLFRFQSSEELKEIALQECQFTEDDFKAFLIYTSGVFSNLGNYKGYGDTKIIPNLDKAKFKKLLLRSKYANLHHPDITKLLLNCLNSVYSTERKDQILGFPYQATTKYLSKNFLKEDEEIVNDFLRQKKIEAANSRLIKTVDDDGTTCYEIRLASVLKADVAEASGMLKENLTENSHKFLITRGDYSKLLKLVNENLNLAKEFVENENQKLMIKKYIESFHTGCIDAHKDGSRFWVKDKGPIIETYIGFIETYKDPAGVRGEFEGFVAMVNKPMSAKFAVLVELSEKLLELLPWPSTYEKDTFLQPDFSCLEVLTFAASDVPIGINIPNYDDIRQNEGFKNVTLGNVIRMKSNHPPNFLCKADQELFAAHRVDALELQTGLHELLGHGSGKLFQKKEDGSFNFDADKVLNYETNQKISSWYEEGDTYSTVFGALSSSFEECRAECIGLYFSTVPDVLKIFGLEGAVADNVLYVNWVDCIFMGLEALKSYDINSGNWMQAHGQAAYVMLQVLLECEGDFVTIEEIVGADGKPDLLFTMDRTKIMSHGKPWMEKFLKKLQLYKATADIDSARKLFDKYSAVTDEGKYPFLHYKTIVFSRKKPRQLIVQPNTFLEDGNVELKNYEASPEGLIQSYIDRYQGINIDEILEELWEKDKIHFT